jgi:hypothetical protein
MAGECAMLSADASHLRKYLATLGVAIIAGTLSIAGLAMRLQNALLVKQVDLVELTPQARETLERRQDYEGIITVALPFFVLVGVLVGAGLAIYGLVGWADRQRRADELEDNALLKSRTEVRQLTEAEQHKKISNEVQAVLELSGIEGAGAYSTASPDGRAVVETPDPQQQTSHPISEPETPSNPKSEQPATQSRPHPEPEQQSDGASRPGDASPAQHAPEQASEAVPGQPPSAPPERPEIWATQRAAIMRKMLDAELQLGGKILDGFGNTHDVHVGVRAASNGRVREFDAVAFPHVEGGRTVVFEMKYVTNGASLVRVVSKAIEIIADGASLFDNAAVPVVIGIYDGEVLEPERMGQIWSRVAELSGTYEIAPRVVILHTDEFEKTSGAALRNRLGL